MSESLELKDLILKARRRMMDLIAMRDHSEKELRTKLRRFLNPSPFWKKKYQGNRPQSPTTLSAGELEEQAAHQKDLTNQAIDAAIEYAKEHRWLGEPEELSEKMAKGLHHRNKGSYYINQWLNEKGLPPIEVDKDLELEKARSLVKNKFAKIEKPTREEKAKMMRFLAARGFDLDTIRKAIHEEF